MTIVNYRERKDGLRIENSKLEREKGWVED